MLPRHHHSPRRANAEITRSECAMVLSHAARASAHRSHTLLWVAVTAIRSQRTLALHYITFTTHTLSHRVQGRCGMCIPCPPRLPDERRTHVHLVTVSATVYCVSVGVDTKWQHMRLSCPCPINRRRNSIPIRYHSRCLLHRSPPPPPPLTLAETNSHAPLPSPLSSRWATRPLHRPVDSTHPPLRPLMNDPPPPQPPAPTPAHAQSADKMTESASPKVPGGPPPPPRSKRGQAPNSGR